MLKRKDLILDSMLAGILFLMVLLMMLLNSCKHEPDVLPAVPAPVNNNGGGNGDPAASTCDPDSVYFQTQVLPLLVSNCAKSGCHSPEDHKEGIILNNYNNVMSTGDVDPGRPWNSKIFEVLYETDPDKIMPPPPATPLTQNQKDLLYNWIAQGAQNNTCSDACDTNNVTFSGTIFPLLQGSCVGCHSGTNPGGLVRLENYATILTVAQNGKLLGSVSHAPGYQAMPKGGNQLAACRIDQIRIWIENGAANN
jgi:hypothetical protein